MIRRCLAALIVILALPGWSWAWRGKVVQVHEGDMITVMHDSREEKIRLYGIDCPERRQPFFEEAKGLTTYLLLSKPVEVIPVSKISEGMTYALVRADGVRDFVNQQLIAYGMAWVYEKLCNAQLCKEWKKLEAMAKVRAIGLWADPDPVPPWEWRKERPGGVKKDSS